MRIIKEARDIKRDDVIKVPVRTGWEDTERGKGSHSVFIPPETKRITTIPFVTALRPEPNETVCLVDAWLPIFREERRAGSGSDRPLETA